MGNHIHFSSVMSFNEKTINQAISNIKSVEDVLSLDEHANLDVSGNAVRASFEVYNTKLANLADSLLSLADFYYLSKSVEGNEYAVSVSDQNTMLRYDKFVEFMGSKEQALQESMTEFFGENNIKKEDFESIVASMMDEYEKLIGSSEISGKKIQESVRNLLTTASNLKG
jgi:hypothetical protein